MRCDWLFIKPFKQKSEGKVTWSILLHLWVAVIILLPARINRVAHFASAYFFVCALIICALLFYKIQADSSFHIIFLGKSSLARYNAKGSQSFDLFYQICPAFPHKSSLGWQRDIYIYL